MAARKAPKQRIGNALPAEVLIGTCSSDQDSSFGLCRGERVSNRSGSCGHDGVISESLRLSSGCCAMVVVEHAAEPLAALYDTRGADGSDWRDQAVSESLVVAF
jgi:hypothetical protein